MSNDLPKLGKEDHELAKRVAKQMVQGLSFQEAIDDITDFDDDEEKHVRQIWSGRTRLKRFKIWVEHYETMARLQALTKPASQVQAIKLPNGQVVYPADWHVSAQYSTIDLTANVTSVTNTLYKTPLK